MNDIKLFVKMRERGNHNKGSEDKSDDIGIEFGLEKWVMLVMQSLKQQMTEGIKLTAQGKIRRLWEKEPYKYLVILKVGTIKQVEIKEKNILKIRQMNEKLFKTKLHSRNLIKRNKHMDCSPRSQLGNRLPVTHQLDQTALTRCHTPVC